MRRVVGVGAITGVVSALVLGCLSTPDWYDANPMLAVHVWGGFAEERPAADRAQHVEVLLDRSAAMATPMPAGPSRAEVARTAAARLVLELPEDAFIRVSDVGSGRHCEPPRPLGSSAPGEDRIAVAATLARLEAGGEGSIAKGLLALAESLRIRPETTRVAAFTDLSDACGGDLCEAIAALESVGASLDLVVIGGAPIPECVGALKRAAGTGDLPATIGERRIPFRVLLDGAVAVAGQVGDTPVEVPADLVTLVIDLDPPLSIGPLRLTPDAVTWLEILEFPNAQPRVREWRWVALLATADEASP